MSGMGVLAIPVRRSGEAFPEGGVEDAHNAESASPYHRSPP